MGKIVLPRTDEDGRYYISYSQITAFKKSKRDYIRRYFMGEKDDNVGLAKYGEFGSRIGTALETNDFSSFERYEQDFLKTLPRLGEFEREIKLDMGDYFVLGYIDSNTLPEDGYIKQLLDYKTADISSKKGDYESDDYWQLHIYSAALKQEFGRLPDSAKVVIIGRSGVAFKGEELKLNGEHCVVDKDISQEKIDKVVQGVRETTEEISRLYKAYLKLNLLK